MSNLDVTTYLADKFPPLHEDDGLADPCRYLIDSVHIPVFNEALQSLFGFGPKLLFYPDSQGLTIKACNLARTASGIVTLSAEFFGAVHTYDWPESIPCCSVHIKDIHLFLRKTSNYKLVEHVVLDLEPNADGVVLRVLYKNSIGVTSILATDQIYANGVPKDEQPEPLTSVIYVMGREFRTVLSTLGKEVPEVGFFICLQGIVVHTLCCRSLRSRSKKSAVQLKNLVNATLLKEECFLEVELKELEMLAKFAETNDAVMKFYFTETEKPLFVVVDLHGLCSVTFVLSTDMVEVESTRKIIGQMMPQLKE